MTTFTLENARSVMGGVFLRRSEGEAVELRGASIDSRTIGPGQVFFALRGDNTDGHRYVGAAAEAGAGLAIVDEPAFDVSGLPPTIAVLRVANVTNALASLAAWAREQLGTTRVIGVTGSAGKTTTTRLIDGVLSASMRGACSIKSYNNLLGVSLTILNCPPGAQYLVCELGTSERGEIDALTHIARPHVGVVTSIGRAHVEGLGSVEQIALEKSSLLRGLERGGVAIATADAPALRPHLRSLERLVTFGVSEDADLRLTSVEADERGVRFTINGRESFDVPLLGAHNAMNAAAAVAVARRFGLEQAAIQEGLSSVRGVPMRLERQTVGEVTILNDAYNANPESMVAALRTLETVGGGRRVAVLGDMLEQGELSEPLHRELGERLSQFGSIDLVVLVGEAMRHAADATKGGGAPVEHVDSLDEQGLSKILELVEPGDVVLLKASRGMRLERVGEALAGRAGSSRRVGAGDERP